jgi:REP element-mobilizing transposase RayT
VGVLGRRWWSDRSRRSSAHSSRESDRNPKPLQNTIDSLLINTYMSWVRAQLDLVFRNWGGKRKGAGRPAAGWRVSEPHRTRERFQRRTAFHVTLRIVDGVASLRAPDAYHAVRETLERLRSRDDFGVVHISIEHDHVHMLVEADSDISLAKGMQTLQIWIARRLNRARGRAGRLFDDRYHPVKITSPTQARRAIVYVLNNFRRHGLDNGWATQFWDVDFYSSGPVFTGWQELEIRPLEIPAGYRALPVAAPRTWMLAAGWRRAGAVSQRDVPGTKKPAR